ncbi:peptidoglycan-associated lipoprotein Pal [Sandaracinobacter sp. RS1-74]|uniref:peptidoglycan-associated lipoprotein Pal n=1 Tax=Sandaracinobacteroides sayramensis TaxID=2913411 RepID=UPI001EDB7DDF|nr:peptidoglycan-associated lipoprotein Pal [Sandaracinobacteroides sayramensis]MCG2839797.1 peptidoglycan-associated lipoprotein Pal [Sandaracinobacteroides sayramensis]
MNSQLNTRAFPLLMLAGALALGACTKNRDVLPPEAWQPAPAQPPAEAPIDQAGTVPPPEQVGSSALPGSQAALIEAAGSDTILFPFDSYGLDETARQILGAQAEWIARNPGVRVLIEGHADERGTREYNLALGERRANAAKNFLAAQGVGADRMSIISYGKERPAVDGSNEEAWARNRRAVTVVVAGGR